MTKRKSHPNPKSLLKYTIQTTEQVYTQGEFQEIHKDNPTSFMNILTKI